VCALLNGDIASDLNPNPNDPNLPIFYIYNVFYITLMGEISDFKFDGQVNHSTFQPADDKLSLKGAWSGSQERF